MFGHIATSSIYDVSKLANRRYHSNVLDTFLTQLELTDHVLDALGRQFSAHQIPPRTFQELKSALLDIWCAFTKDMKKHIGKLYGIKI